MDDNGSSSLNDGQSSDTERQSRPIGRERAKEQLKKTAEAGKKIKLAAESVAAQVERNETLHRHYELMLFTNAPPECDQSEAVEYFSTMRAQALTRIRNARKKEDKRAEDTKLITEHDEGKTVIKATTRNAEKYIAEIRDK